MDLLIRCPAFCVKIVKDKKGKVTKIPGYLKEVEQEKPTGKLFCDTPFCIFLYRDENGRDVFSSDADLLKIPLQDPLIEVNLS